MTLSTQFKAIICFDAVSLTDDRQSACQEIIALGKLQNSQVGINTNATIRQYFWLPPHAILKFEIFCTGGAAFPEINSPNMVPTYL